jgi:Sec-independent protein secretion pathway component TatC
VLVVINFTEILTCFSLFRDHADLCSNLERLGCGIADLVLVEGFHVTLDSTFAAESVIACPWNASLTLPTISIVVSPNIQLLGTLCKQPAVLTAVGICFFFFFFLPDVMQKGNRIAPTHRVSVAVL